MDFHWQVPEPEAVPKEPASSGSAGSAFVNLKTGPTTVSQSFADPLRSLGTGALLAKTVTPFAICTLDGNVRRVGESDDGMV